MKISFLPEIENDILAPYQWYDSKSNGLGEEFLRVFYSEIAEISRFPKRYPIVFKNFRRTLFRRFPYAIYFLVDDDEVSVYGVFHCSRDPRWMQETIDKRPI